MIVKKDGKFVLMSKAGDKVLGIFDTEEEALKREKQIQQFTESICSIELLESDPLGKEFEVVLIQPGKSKNGFTYPAELLKKSVKMFEGVKAFAYGYGDKFDHIKSNESGTGAKNLVGDYVDARFVEGKGVVARFRCAATWLRDLLKNGIEAGQELLGFSIDATGSVKESVVNELFNINEVTVVTNPAAGGRVLRMLASEQKTNKEKDKMNELIKKLNEALKLSLPEDATPEQLVEAIRNADRPEQISKKQIDVWVKEALALRESEKDKAAKEKQEKETATAKLIETKLSESKLPDIAKNELRESLKGREVDETELDRLLAARQKMLASLQESGVNVPGQEQKIKVGDEQFDIISKRFDLMWENEGAKDGVEPFLGLHEAARECLGMNGSPYDMGNCVMTAMNLGARPLGSNLTQEQHNQMLRESQIDQSFKHFNLKESTTTTSDFSTALSSSMNRYLIKEYRRPNRSNWMKVVTIQNAKDFRSLRSVRVGGFADLATVSENAAYANFSKVNDEESTYAVTKKGNTYPVSFETITNDDIGVIRRRIANMGMAAARTLNKAVWSVLDTNAAMDYDSVALFHASHSNLTTSALSSTTLNAGILAMLSQTEKDSSAILGLEPGYLIVPYGLQGTAIELLNQKVTLSGARTETVPNDYVNKFNLELIADPDLTTLDANNWYLAARPADSSGIDVAFLGGRREPEFFVQNQQTVGSVFNADVITWKIRHIWAVSAVEHRAFYGGVVA